MTTSKLPPQSPHLAQMTTPNLLTWPKLPAQNMPKVSMHASHRAARLAAKNDRPQSPHFPKMTPLNLLTCPK